jgi:hypothetical protein
MEGRNSLTHCDRLLTNGAIAKHSINVDATGWWAYDDLQGRGVDGAAGTFSAEWNQQHSPDCPTP